MSKHKVVHFEIPSSDAKKSKAFYEKVFGWKVVEDDESGYMMAMTTEVDKDSMTPTETGGINGGFYKRESKKDQPTFVIETDSIDKSLKDIEKAGGKASTPKHAIGEYGFMADFVDVDGNEISLWENAMKK